MTKAQALLEIPPGYHGDERLFLNPFQVNAITSNEKTGKVMLICRDIEIQLYFGNQPERQAEVVDEWTERLANALGVA